jgi:hypothetical protein
MLLFSVHVYSLTATFILEIKGKLHLVLIVLLLMPFVFLNDYNGILSLNSRLNNNSLTGQIPKSLTAITTLQVL